MGLPIRQIINKQPSRMKSPTCSGRTSLGGLAAGFADKDGPTIQQ